MKWPGVRLVCLAHRWIGISTCVFISIWLGSGLVMMYVPYPSLSPSTRMSHLLPIAWNEVRIDPDQALAAAGATFIPTEFRLEMMGDIPVYRIQDRVSSQTIDARDGRRISIIGALSARQIARRWSGATAPTLIETIARDQWTVGGGYNGMRPFYLMAINDADGTHVYVSVRSGEIALQTTRRQRAWNWVGSVPHWLYFTMLRSNALLWRQVILWVSGMAMVGIVAGFWIGLLRLRLRKPYQGSRCTPHTGCKRWHHLAGTLGGFFLCTWMFSGWLSLNPLGWLSGDDGGSASVVRYEKHQALFTGNPLPGTLSRMSDVRQVSFLWRGDKRMLVLSDGASRRGFVDARSGTTTQLPQSAIVACARELLPDARLIEVARLDHEEDHWYSRHERRPLPVLRVKFDDPSRTWFYLDLKTGEVLLRVQRADRSYRWWFSALHTWDFPALIGHRPAWDIVMWLLALTGLIVSLSGCVMGWRRLRR